MQPCTHLRIFRHIRTVDKRSVTIFPRDLGRIMPNIRKQSIEADEYQPVESVEQSLFGAVRRRTMICCRRARFSASRLARDRNNPISSDHSNLQASHIERQHHPIPLPRQPDDISNRDRSSHARFGRPADVQLRRSHCRHDPDDLRKCTAVAPFPPRPASRSPLPRRLQGPAVRTWYRAG